MRSAIGLSRIPCTSASCQMPLCARCTGEFNAAAMALIFQALVSPRHSLLPRRGILAVLAVFFLAFALDGSNSYLALMRSMEPGHSELDPEPVHHQ